MKLEKLDIGACASKSAAYLHLGTEAREVLSNISKKDMGAMYLLLPYAKWLHVYRYSAGNTLSEVEWVDFDSEYNKGIIDRTGKRMCKMNTYMNLFMFDNLPLEYPDMLNEVMYNVLYLYNGEFYYSGECSVADAVGELSCKEKKSECRCVVGGVL